jgi:hypothetical protein
MKGYFYEKKTFATENWVKGFSTPEWKCLYLPDVGIFAYRTNGEGHFTRDKEQLTSMKNHISKEKIDVSVAKEYGWVEVPDDTAYDMINKHILITHTKEKLEMIGKSLVDIINKQI